MNYLINGNWIKCMYAAISGNQQMNLNKIWPTKTQASEIRTIKWKFIERDQSGGRCESPKISSDGHREASNFLYHIECESLASACGVWQSAQTWPQSAYKMEKKAKKRSTLKSSDCFFYPLVVLLFFLRVIFVLAFFFSPVAFYIWFDELYQLFICSNQYRSNRPSPKMVEHRIDTVDNCCSHFVCWNNFW